MSNNAPPINIRHPLVILAWVVMLGGLWFLFDQVLEQQRNPNRNLTIAPGSSELVLQRNRAGHYLVPGTINGERVTFLLDTGATQVSVPAHLQQPLGLTPGNAMRSLTANGTVTVYATQIDELVIGPFAFDNVRGHLNPGFQGNEILLGMSVLRELEFTQRGDTLTLRPQL
ncbi:MAG: retropepsin-like aspartic protease family protein [Saccharospirillum sp.]